MPHLPARADRHLSTRRVRALLATAAVGGLLLAGPPTTATAVGPSASRVAEPDRVADGHGRTRLLAAPAGRALSTAPAGARGPAAAARAQLRAHAGAFGLRDLSGLRAVSVRRDASGHDVVRFAQTVDGIPVLGGQLVTVLDKSRSLVSVSGEVTRGAVRPAYPVAASAAARAARRATARAHDLRAGRVDAGRPTRLVLDPSLITPGAAADARPVWRVEVTAPGLLEVRDLVLVDARTGRVALRIDQVAHALDRVVCDAAGALRDDEMCRPGDYDRVEGQPPTGITDVDQAFDLTGATAGWYAAQLGVDLTALIGADLGDGPKLRSTTRYCGTDGCPLDNAFWNGTQMVYGEGFTSADDVVAHELTHGVTQQTAGLLYWFQSGAINESLSDIFGELADLGNGVGNDSDEVRWLLGEDLPAAAGGVARDMADPTAYGQPDHTGSEFYDFAPDYDDNGAVHTNSGVPNKTAYLIADGTATEPGGVFNGRAFGGIGTAKTALLHWVALGMLTPGADFVDLAAALQQGCVNLAATGAGGFAGTDCDVVAASTAATGLSRWTSPTVPRKVRMRTGVKSVLLTWAKPASSGSSPLNSFAVWVRPALDPQEDFLALEPSARSYLVKDLRPGVDYRIGVLAVTADGTSPAVVRGFRGSALQVDWPRSVTFGDRLRLTGVLAGADGTALADRAVTLLRRLPGEPGYDPVAEATTGPDGRFRLGVAARRAATYVVVYAGEPATVGDRTRRHEVPVRQAVSLLTDRSLRPAQVPRFRGAVRPERARAVVLLQRRGAAGSWRTVSRARTDARGRFEVAGPVGPVGSSAWRVRVGPWRSAGLAAGLSRVVTITRS